MADYQTLLVDSHAGVLEVTLNRPECLNALSSQLLNELREVLARAAEDADIRCVLLTGAGRGFSSGADLADQDAGILSGSEINLGASLEERYHPILELIRTMPKPVVAAVNGTAAGAGCNIALAADFILAADTAQFIQAFIRIGLVPDAGGTWTIPRLIGRARALRWMMTGEAIDAVTAEQWGMLTAIYPAAELMSQAREQAARLAQAPTQALARIKTLVDQAETQNLSAQMAEEARLQQICGREHDFMEGVQAFLHKRSASFRGY